MKIGYARVGFAEENLDLQIGAIKKAGCETIYQEYITGKKSGRPELQKMLNQLRAGDQVVVWKLDRLGLSLKDLIQIVAVFHDTQVNFISIKDGIDTSTPTGPSIFHLNECYAELDRDLISLRTKPGLSAAKVRGRTGGRKKGLPPEAIEVAKRAKLLYDSPNNQYNYKEVAAMLGVSSATCYRYVKYIKDLEPEQLSK